VPATPTPTPGVLPEVFPPTGDGSAAGSAGPFLLLMLMGSAALVLGLILLGYGAARREEQKIRIDE
jgi:hypothetical protein